MPLPQHLTRRGMFAALFTLGETIMGKIEDLEAKVDKAIVDAAALEARAVVAEGRATTAEADKATLQGQLTTAQGQVADLTTQLQAAQAAGVTLPDDIFTKLDQLDAGLVGTIPDSAAAQPSTDPSAEVPINP
jgi:hypothetical protein